MTRPVHRKPNVVIVLFALLWMRVAFSIQDLVVGPVLDQFQGATQPELAAVAAAAPMSMIVAQAAAAGVVAIGAITINSRHPVAVAITVIGLIASIIMVLADLSIAGTWIGYALIAAGALGCLAHPDTRKWLNTRTESSDIQD